MNFPASIDDFPTPSELKDPLHLAIGIFDGVHLGHKAVIAPSVINARRCNGVSGVLTFDPHPSHLFRPNNPTPLIMPIHAKTAILHEIGVDCVIRKHFDAAFASIPAKSFLARLKKTLPSLTSIYVGENFRFGQNREGDVATLIKSGHELDLGVFSAERIKHEREPISSTRIRKKLEAGEITEVNDLLGHNYKIQAQIVDGAKLGRKIGFPTLNLPWQPECKPRFGVYFVRFAEGGTTDRHAAIANYGVRPPVADVTQEPILEIHALNGTTLATKDTVNVELLHFIRPEQKFNKIEDLKAQIVKDCASARKMDR